MLELTNEEAEAFVDTTALYNEGDKEKPELGTGNAAAGLEHGARGQARPRSISAAYITVT